jgi:hypothetical protein
MLIQMPWGAGEYSTSFNVSRVFSIPPPAVVSMGGVQRTGVVRLGVSSDSCVCAARPLACTRNQGLTLVDFSAQLELCLTQENTLHTLNTP